MRCSSVNLFVFLLLTVCPVSLLRSQSIADSAPFQMEPSRLYEAALHASEGADSDAVVLLVDRRIVYQADGTPHERHWTVYRILTEAGADSWDSVSASWRPWQQEKPVVKARVIAKDGAVHELDPATVVEAAASQNADSVYRDTRVLRGPLPAIEKGSVVERLVEIRGKSALFESGEVSKYIIGSIVPVKKWKMTVEAPSSIPLRFVVKLAGDLKPVDQEVDETRRLVFETGLLETLERVDSNIPKDEPRWPSVSFSTGESWSDLARTYARIIDERVSVSNLREQVAKAIEGRGSREEIVRALVAHLHEEVRYTGIEFGQASFIPHPPNATRPWVADTATVKTSRRC